MFAEFPAPLFSVFRNRTIPSPREAIYCFIVSGRLGRSPGPVRAGSRCSPGTWRFEPSPVRTCQRTGRHPSPWRRTKYLRALLIFAEAPGSRPLAMRLERQRLLDLFFDDIMPDRQVRVDVLLFFYPSSRGGIKMSDSTTSTGRTAWDFGSELLGVLGRIGPSAFVVAGFLFFAYFFTRKSTGQGWKLMNSFRKGQKPRKTISSTFLNRKFSERSYSRPILVFPGMIFAKQQITPPRYKQVI